MVLKTKNFLEENFLKLLIVESPTKSNKIQKFLGNGWMVRASMGHIVDLADTGPHRLGFTLEANCVRCQYVPRKPRGAKVLAELKKAIQQASEIYLATDPDREGESISWHIVEQLHLKKYHRVRFTEITETAIKKAIAQPQTLDLSLVNAALGRSCVDKLVGYRVSQLLWGAIAGAKSAGRVQSAALHILVKRERELLAFVPQDYWSVWAIYQEGFKAFYCGNSQINATDDDSSSEETDDAKDRDEHTNEMGQRVTTQQAADQLVEIARTHPHQVISIQQKRTKNCPPPPFTTSSLQQAAGVRLSMSPERTMKIAQQLYENGYITYMRTDSVTLSDEFCAAVRDYLENNDPDNLPQKVTVHRSKASAQEAHEAIRPTDINRTPQLASAEMSAEEAQLYSLIWHRTLASQCRSAELNKTRIITRSLTANFEARGQQLLIPGYTRYWKDIDADTFLPALSEGESLSLERAGADKKQTQPPPRYTEPKLVQVLERRGVGRPSTYATILATLKQRNYVEMNKKKLQPTQLGINVDQFLEQVLPNLIDSNFTAQMEQELDAIATGKQNWQQWLTSWNREYFEPALAKASKEIEMSPNQTSRQSEVTNILCPKCNKQMVKLSSNNPKVKAGHFLGCDKYQDGCGTVMFWNERTSCYELPYSERSTPDPNRENLTALPCPVCNAPLEKFEYSDKKTGQPKTMLRCSKLENRQESCQNVAFWWTSRNQWWSPTYGEIESENKHIKAVEQMKSKQPEKQRKKTPRSA